MKMDRVEEDLHSGQRVQTADGRRLGSIKEVFGSHLKVDARFRSDYWLPAGAIVRIDGDTVTLGFTKDELGGYRTERPEIDAAGSTDGILTDAEQDEQRARMERELEEQRHTLAR
jgi:hypothetical protein